MVNKVILAGNLGGDPDYRSLPNGASVAQFSLATSESYKDKNGEWAENVEWHTVVVWRRLADRARETLKKGTAIYLEGKLTHETWEGEDGRKRYTTKVVANYFRVLSGKAGGQNREGYFPTEENEPTGETWP